MPILSAAGGAASKGFGQFAKQSSGRKFVGLGGNNITPSTDNIRYSDTSLAGPYTTFSTTPSPTRNIYTPGIIADGDFIVVGSAQYSINNGASWTAITNSPVSPSGCSPCLNGSIAYNPTGKRAGSFYIAYSGKQGVYKTYFVHVTAAGYGGSSGYGNNYSTPVASVMYSSALDTFFVRGLEQSGTGVICANGSTGSVITYTSVGQPGSIRGGISSDGYPLLPSYAGYGTTFYLRKYTSSDLSSYTQLGTISGSIMNYTTNSPIVWSSVNNKYFVAAGYSGTTIGIYGGTSDPLSMNLVGSFSVNYLQYVLNLGLVETSEGHLYVYGVGQYNYGKGPTTGILPTYRSTDGGVTWSNSGVNSLVTASENFSA